MRGALSDGDDESLEAQLPSVLQKITATIGEGDDIDAADDDGFNVNYSETEQDQDILSG